MKKRIGAIARVSVVLTFGLIAALLTGCGSSDNPTSSTTSGSLSVSSSGTTPAAVTKVAAPAGSTLTLQPSTTLTDVNNQPVMGNISTSVTFATSAADLPAAAETPVVPDVATFLDIDLGGVKNINPPMAATLAVPGAAAGTLVDIYSFNGTAWVLEYPDVPVAADGTVSVNVSHLTIWATGRKNTLRISGTPKTGVVVGTAYSFVPNVVASKKSSLTFSIVNQPPWTYFDASTGALTGTPTAANVGTITGVVISVTDGTLTKSLPAFNLTVNDVVGLAPTITSISPTSMRVNTEKSTLTITGTNLTGATLAISGTGVTLGTAKVSATQITVPVTVRTGATTGDRTLTVSTAGGTASTTFTVDAVRRSPTITSIAPASMNQGTTGSVVITGTNLTSATLAISGSGVTFGTATVTSTQITVPTTVSATATPGVRTLTVTTARGSAAVAFTVNAVTPAPVITSVSPATMTQGTSGVLSLSGSNLTGATLIITGSGVTLGTATVTDTLITVPATVIGTATTGVRTITVATPGGSTTVGFTISAAATPAPTIGSISPTSMYQGTSGTLTITGTNLTGASLAIAGTGGVTFGTPTVTATQITVTATVNVAATAGSRTLTVTTSGGSATAAFTVLAVTGSTGGTGTGTIF